MLVNTCIHIYTCMYMCDIVLFLEGEAYMFEVVHGIATCIWGVFLSMVHVITYFRLVRRGRVTLGVFPIWLVTLYESRGQINVSSHMYPSLILEVRLVTFSWSFSVACVDSFHKAISLPHDCHLCCLILIIFQNQMCVQNMQSAIFVVSLFWRFN